MATIVASRFAVLSVDDDDDDDVSVKKKKVSVTKKPTEVKPQNAAPAKSNGNTKKKRKQEVTQPQTSKNSKPNSGNTSKKKRKPIVVQWDDLKSKDLDNVESTFEEDLSRAIYLSKLEFQQKNKVNGTVGQSEKNKKSNSSKKNKKNQKVNSFKELNSSDCKNSKKVSVVGLKTEEFVEEPEFFDEVNDIQNELSQENLQDSVGVKDLNSQESLTLVLYKAYIEKKDREIEQLKEEIERLNVNLKNVKIRNTKLCQVIANGEMKDKAEVLMEVERLQTIKDELSSEVATLHIQLEQERSKVRQLATDHKNKDKSKKHHINSNELH